MPTEPAAHLESGADASPDTAEIVAMRDLHFAWPGRRPFSMAVKDFSLEKGRHVLLIGPSGSGKSTFLSLLCGIVVPDSGRIAVLGKDLAKLSRPARDTFRAEHFGIIFQMFNLLPYGGVRDNVMLPLRFSASRRRRASERGPAEREVDRLLASLGLAPAEVANAPASQLSVGQQQRVAAARALIGRPELIVADEPTSSLDRNRQAAFLDLLFAEAGSAGSTVLMVSHDESLGGRFDKVLRLDDFATTSRDATP